MFSKWTLLTIRVFVIVLAVLAVLAVLPAFFSLNEVFAVSELLAIVLTPAGLAVLISRWLAGRERGPLRRFSLRSLMIVIAILALPLAFFPVWGLSTWGVVLLFLAVFSTPAPVAVGVSVWFVVSGRRRQATITFWIASILFNILYAVLSCLSRYFFWFFPEIGWVFIVAPTIAVFGSAWISLAIRPGSTPRRFPAAASLLVLCLMLLPVLTMYTLWPLRAAFLISKPSLERLADQVASGQAVVTPRWAGVFRVVDSEFDPKDGLVRFSIGRGKRMNLFRHRSGDVVGGDDRHSLLSEEGGNPDLGDGWSYGEEDRSPIVRGGNGR